MMYQLFIYTAIAPLTSPPQPAAFLWHRTEAGACGVSGAYGSNATAAA
jgi:hypothetical protein